MALSTEHVLVTGGAGYIGSHTTLQLLQAGAKVTIIDNYCNSSPKVLPRLRELAGEDLAGNLSFIEADIGDHAGLEEKVFAPAAAAGSMYTSCIHFAGLKAVGESVAKPLLYYHNNITGTLVLLELLYKHGCKRLVFSSSATVYGSAPSPLSEEGSTTGQGITNPYGQTKYMIECILNDFARANEDFGVVVLRYFNPVGAHPSGRIGESPNGIPNNLMPYVQQVAVGKREKLTVFGDDYDTPDGTGVRDYIHVEDLAAGHLAALEKMHEEGRATGSFVYNLGTGTGYSVLEMVRAMEESSGKTIPFVVGPRRPGDLASCYSIPTKARDELGWTAKRTLQDMCDDAWRWQSQNPNGYDD